MFRYPRSLKRRSGAFCRGLTAKAQVLLTGQGPVSETCQIPEIRKKYADLAMPKIGLFVEIGAFDGEEFSNTSFLADEGWRGLYVEPAVEFCRQARFRHAFNNVSVANLAITPVAGITEMRLMGPLSTLDASVARAYSTIAWAKPEAENATSIKVMSDTLVNLLASYSIPEQFDLMVIDVEGGEEPIVSGLLESTWRPRVLIVELCDLHGDFLGHPDLQSRHAKVRNDILKAGYIQYHADPINTIFVRN